MGCFVTVLRKNACAFCGETPATRASGLHDFAVRYPRALVSCAGSVHRISTRVRDDREAPLVSGETTYSYTELNFR